MARPRGTLELRRTLTCIMPETRWGAEPAYRTSTGTPPMLTATGRTGLRRSVAMMRPSWPAGSVWPSPVAKRTRTESGGAGLVRVLREPFSLSAAA